jgi:hypothetical protein
MKTYLSLMVLCLALTGCGGGGSSAPATTQVTDPTGPGPTTQSVVPYSGIGGYYSFSDSAAGSWGHLVVGVDGTFTYDISVGGCYSLASGKFSLASDGYTINNSNSYLTPQGGCAGSSTLQVSGDWIAGSEIDLYGQDGSQVEWKWQGDVSQAPASLADLVGSYQFSDGSDLVVKADGSLSISDFGCAITGKVSVPDETLNVYTLTATISGCSGDYASLNGLVATGLFTRDINDDQIVGSISVTLNGRLVTLLGSAQLL